MMLGGAIILLAEILFGWLLFTYSFDNATIALGTIALAVVLLQRTGRMDFGGLFLPLLLLAGAVAAVFAADALVLLLRGGFRDAPEDLLARLLVIAGDALIAFGGYVLWQSRGARRA
jgi:hypothetical protein